MQFFKMAAMALSTLAIASLSACGGGGDAAAGSPPTNTLQLEAGTGSNIPVGRYALDTNYADASGTVQVGSLTVEFVWPENIQFDSGLAFARGDVRKYMIGLFENNPSGATYSCVSTAWTPSELSALAAAFQDTSILTLQKCPSSVVVAIDAATHRMTFKHLTLADDGGTSKSVTFSVDAGWRLQTATLQGSGSGTTSPTSSSGSVSLGGIGGITVTGPTAVTPVGLQEASGAH